MKPSTLLPVLALFVIFLSSCSTDSIDDKAQNVNNDYVVPETKVIEVEILELINDYRLSAGLNPLTDLGVIKSQAFDHTDYMIQNSNISHDNFTNRRNFLTANAGARKVSENVAYGYSTASSVVAAWIASDSHRDAIEGDYTHFDISAEQDADGYWYFTNIFIKK
ncbi:CAP domain-containing protein [Lacinutrix iliipiscaria]|uniref:CAP domain-containing protein n=1 Tax=Lacinutrix iliipiscaria TaxID=1230532 RepID=A0ABW5WPS4_9FLAO